MLVVEGSRIAASGVSFTDSEHQNATFAKLEELILVAQGNKSGGFQPTNDCFTSRTDNTQCPVVAVGGISMGLNSLVNFFLKILHRVIYKPYICFVLCYVHDITVC